MRGDGNEITEILDRDYSRDLCTHLALLVYDAGQNQLEGRTSSSSLFTTSASAPVAYEASALTKGMGGEGWRSKWGPGRPGGRNNNNN